MRELMKEYKYVGNKATLYQNRLEMTGLLGVGNDVISLKNISSVEIPTFPPLAACIDIKTNDGIKHRIPVKLKDRKDLRNRIMELI